MKKIKQMIKNKIKDENGVVVIVEASFVFPIMFFVIFFLFFMGNMYFARAYSDNLVNETAIRMAAECADPNLNTITSSGDAKIPATMKNEPYRYFFNSDVIGGDGTIDASKNLAKNLIYEEEGSLNTFFEGMEPKINKSDIDVKFNNNIINYTLSVTATYKISLPWKFIFSDEVIIQEFTSHAEVPVSDAPEFIRNIDMAVDYLQRWEKANEAADKLKSLFNSDSINKMKSNSN